MEVAEDKGSTRKVVPDAGGHPGISISSEVVFFRLGEVQLLFYYEIEGVHGILAGSQIDKLFFQSFGITAMVTCLLTGIANTELYFELPVLLRPMCRRQGVLLFREFPGFLFSVIYPPHVR